MPSIPNVPDTIACEIYAELCRSLPPPPDDTPEARAIREQHAVAAVAHLLPENVAEGNVAVQIVAAQFHARDALQGAVRSGLDPEDLRRCRAWAASMMRQADSGIRTLLRMQAERQKAEDALRPAAMQRAGYWFRSVSEPEPAGSPTTSPGSTERESPGSTPEAPPPPGPPRLEYGAITLGERYVTLYPDRAAAVLAAGGLPARLNFPPPDPALIEELLSSNSPLVRAFRESHAPLAA